MANPAAAKPRRAPSGLEETSRTQAVSSTASAFELAQAIAVDDSIVEGASTVTAPGQTFAVFDSPLGGFPTHGTGAGILTTGDPAIADDPNDFSGNGTDMDGGSVRGDTDFDVTILKMDLAVPADKNCLSLDFRFLSEEYDEYVGSSFNDTFIAELDESNWTTEGSSITAPNNFAFDRDGNEISINSVGFTSMSFAAAAGTTYDGATDTLKATTSISPGDHSLYLSIFDQGDPIYDSAVFLDALFLHTKKEGTCALGAQPVDQSLDYVALGDSFSAGEGVDPYFGKSRCHRSIHAYSTLVQPPGYPDTLFNLRTSDEVGWSFPACSGAVTNNVLPWGKGNHGELDPQLKHPANGPGVDLVTITIGGNDARFSDWLKKCAFENCKKHGVDGVLLPNLPDKMWDYYDRLEKTYRAVVNKNQYATVVVLNYPMLFPRTNEEQTCFKLSPFKGEQDLLRQAQKTLHGVMKSAAQSVGVHYLDVTGHFAGHEVCGNDGEWINSVSAADVKCKIRWGWPKCTAPIDDETFHPKKRGQREYAVVLNDWLAGHGEGLPPNPPPG